MTRFLHFGFNLWVYSLFTHSSEFFNCKGEQVQYRQKFDMCSTHSNTSVCARKLKSYIVGLATEIQKHSCSEYYIKATLCVIRSSVSSPKLS